MHPLKIESRDPQDLSLHPARKAVPALPEWGKDGPQFIALVENVRLRGLQHPLDIDEEDRIIGGEPRWRAAKQLQLEKVPVIVRKSAEAASFILEDKLLRAQLPSQSAKAFWAWPLIEKAFDESKDHHIEFLKAGGQRPNLDAGRKSKKSDDFAAELGIGRQYFFDAKKVHELFAAHPEPRDIEDDETGETIEGTTFREYYSRRILLGEVRLGAVVAGIAGHLSSKRKPRPETKFFRLFTQGLKRWGYWENLDEHERRLAATHLRDSVIGMPDGVYQEIKTAVKLREKAAK